MIYNYSFSNFQSFKEMTQVDLTLSKKVDLTNWMCETNMGKRERVSKLMGVLGANGSGKTALLKPMAFLGWFINESFRSPPDAEIPNTPHFSSENEPTEFSVLFDMDDKLWRYELRCNKKRVLFESLHQKNERFGYIFIRMWDSKKNQYDIKLKNFEFNLQEALKVRENASLISTAMQYGVSFALNFALRRTVSNLSLNGRIQTTEYGALNAANYFAKKNDHYNQMEKLLSSWDFGLSGVELIEKEVVEKTEQKIWMPYGKHKCRKKEYKLPFQNESSGTRTAFVLLAMLMQVLSQGGIAVIDEFENDLHPHMLEPLLDLFASSKTNPYNAQLLFSCHAPEILNLVDKSQIMLVQKNDDCESTACRLDAVEGIRADDNFYAKYMAGRYGAIPNF
jgi:AAA15 family ATPase/GTPase